MLGIGGGSLGELIVSIGTDLTKLDRGLKTASSRISAASKRMSASLNQTGRSMTMFGAAVTAGFGVAAKGAGDFQEGITNVMTLLDDFDGVIRDEFTEGVERLARKFGESTNILTTSLFDIQSATGDAAGAMDMLESATRLAVGGNSDLKSSTEGLLTLLESYGDELGGAADAADLLFKAQEKARATVGELAVASGRFLPLAKLLKIEVDELFAVFAQLTVALGDSNEASTALTGILNGFIKPTEELKDLTREWGYETAQAALEELGLLEVLKKLADVEDSRLGSLFPRIEGLKGLGAVIQNLSKVEENLIAIRHREGAVDKALEKQMKNFNRQVKIARENIMYLVRTIGNILLPYLTDMFKKLKPIIDRFAEWIEQNEELVKKIVLVTAAVGALALFFGPVLIAISGFIGVLGFAAAGLLRFIYTAKVVAVAVGSFLITPLGLVVVALGVFATAWYSNWNNIREFMTGIARDIGGTIDAIREKFLRMTLTMQNLAAIPLKERLLHPIQSFKAAVELADAAIEALREEDGIGGFADAFEEGMQRGIDKTEEFKLKLQEFKESFNIGDMLGDSDSADSPEGEEDEEANEEKQKKLLDALVPDPAIVKKRYSVLKTLKKLFDVSWLATEKKKSMTLAKLHQSNFDQFKKILHAQAGESKVAAGILKAMAIGEAVINTARGVSAALATPPPMSYVWAAITAALGAMEIATIAGVSFAEGTDSIPARVHPGEMIIPNSFADAIRGGRLTLSGGEGGGGRSINVYNTFDFEHVTITDERDIDELAEELGENIENKIRSL